MSQNDVSNNSDVDLDFKSWDDTKDWRKRGAVTRVKDQVGLKFHFFTMNNVHKRYLVSLSLVSQ